MTPRRRLLAGLAAAGLAAVAPAAFAAPLAAGDQALVDKAVAYLDGLKSAKGRFVQTDARGAVTRGALYLQRPGKARFAYDPPSGLTVVSDGLNVYVADARLKTYDGYPLKSTPLALFLNKTVRLGREAQVTRVAKMSDGFSITAVDAKKATRGQITLDFADGPTRLLGWTVTDARGAATRVRLEDLTPAAGLDAALFRPTGKPPKTKS